MRVVVTGGAGFLGSYVWEVLLRRGDEVVAIDNLCTGDLANVAPLFDRAGFSFVRHNVSQYVHVSGRVDAVMHLPVRRRPGTTWGCRSRPSRSGASARSTRWGWPRTRGPATCWPRPARSTGIPRSTRSGRSTGVM